MKQRIITALFILAVIIPTFILSNTPVYPIVLALVCLTAEFEMLRVLGRERDLPVCIPAYLFALAGPFLAYFPERAWSLSQPVYLGLCAAALFLYMLWLYALAVFRLGVMKFADVGEVFAASLYVILSFTSLSLVRYLPQGVYYFGMVFLAAWVCDVFAYFTGFLFGKHKLIPAISPKKTVEGAVGGTVFATACFPLYGWLLSLFTEATPNYLRLTLFGLLLALVGQIGDLIASLIKREHGIKDYGKLLPGHGGIMDRFDSIIAVSTVLAVLCIAFPPFT